ncbi:MAG: 16S rRNA (uracil(1498)-N(3))-methyltransferase [Planctomycetaceae bacterium]|nr:16S rRNA (uracil(1498)-N(3))-methyltransferase [Planctomycetaceae bacterium]
MAQRYFIDSPPSNDQVTISDREAHHLLHVMRADVGQQVILFDGQGNEFTAEIQALKKSSVELLILDQQSVDRELPTQLTVAVALPKGDRQKWLVEKLVELGTSALVPLITQRGVAQPVPQALVRLQRTVVEASKQCGRNRLMQIQPPQTVDQCIAETADCDRRVFAHLQEDPAGRSVDQHCSGLPASGLVLAIGPEGGWTSQEAEQFLSAGWSAASLGSRVLRIETAALALVARCVLQDPWL